MANLSPSFITVTPPLPTVFTFRDHSATDAAGAVISASVNIGTATSTRLVIVLGGCGGNPGITSVVAAGVTLTEVFNFAGTSGGYRFKAHAGLVTTGSGAQTVESTWASGSGNYRCQSVWTIENPNSTVIKGTSSDLQYTISCSLSVTAGDFIMALAQAGGGTPTWASSTEAPSGERADSLFAGFTSAEWTVANTNASFGVTGTGTGSNADGICVSYR